MGLEERRIWIAADILGMLIAIAGAAGYVKMLPVELGETASLIMIAAGALLVIESLIFTHVEGARLERQIIEHNRLEAIRTETFNVPDSLDGAYIIDYTAEPARAFAYDNDPEPEYSTDDWRDDGFDGYAGVSEAKIEEPVARIGGGKS